jgi:hypothetical protein
VASIIPFLQDDAFDPDALRAMATALDEVCRTLRLNGDQRAREIMAVRIIELARRGERDPERLRDRMLWEAGATSRYLPSADALVAPVEVEALRQMEGGRGRRSRRAILERNRHQFWLLASK